MNKKEAAKLLYLEGYNAAEIAKIISVSENTMSKWVASGDWKGKRIASAVFESTSIEIVRELIGYQLEALRRKKEEYIKEQKWSLLDRGDIDALQKLFTTIRRSELRWDDYVRILRRFLEFIQDKDPELAKQLVEPADLYLNEIRKQMS